MTSAATFGFSNPKAAMTDPCSFELGDLADQFVLFKNKSELFPSGDVICDETFTFSVNLGVLKPRAINFKIVLQIPYKHMDSF